ncbi:hypothetical protein [Streptomyces sp. DSM 41037]|uniref:hypothetical protein n=1 Tax=Streptomyces sp. DSM 41037 TaxID=2817710 RepID=UPI0027D83B11|nr:hypothetical protein [Streptomyces sp. DSM 41037]
MGPGQTVVQAPRLGAGLEDVDRALYAEGDDLRVAVGWLARLRGHDGKPASLVGEVTRPFGRILGDGPPEASGGTRCRAALRRRQLAVHPRKRPDAQTGNAPAVIYTIFEGTSEIQRLVIARTLAGMPIR